ncbi:MAG: hypothetical protein IIY62_01900 [Kiritimatiellae bacterium]|nr:hypothetical protein [Kiritimatiellia bacterium]
MRKNSIRKRTLHSAMKPNAIARAGGGGRKALIVLGAALLAALATGVCIGYAKLRGVYREQFAITDPERQVTIVVPPARQGFGETKPPLAPETVVALFGLRRGANLAEIDFAGLRARILAEQHAIKDLSIRLQPTSRLVRAGAPRAYEDFMHVTITARVRDPVAILSHAGDTALRTVVDAEGVAFEKRFDPRFLPRILERETARTKSGQRLAGRGLAALRLIDYCQQTASAEDAFAPGGDIRIREVDVTSPDYLLAWLSNGHRAKFAWEGMDEQLPGSQDAMVRQVENLRKAIRTGLATSAYTTSITWNATLPGRIFADTKEPIQ